MTRSHTAEMIERFERRLEEIEAQIKPQLDEARALRAGLERLRRGADEETAAATPSHTSAGRRQKSTRSIRQAASPRQRR